MEENLKDLLASYKSGMDMYTNSLPKDNPVLQEALNFISEMEKIAISSNDYILFMDIANEKDFFNKIIQYHSKLAGEISKLPRKTSIPTASEMALPYHNAYNSIPKENHTESVRKVYERVFELEKIAKSGPEFLCYLGEENLILDMSKQHWFGVLEKGLNDLKNFGKQKDSDLGIISLPIQEAYFGNMMKVSSLSQSVIGLEVEALRIAEESIFENLKDNLYLQTVFHSLASPILGYRMAGTKENQIKVVSAYKHWREFWKLEWDELFQIPRVADFVNKTLFGATKSSLAENGIRSPKELQDEMKRYLGKALSS